MKKEFGRDILMRLGLFAALMTVGACLDAKEKRFNWEKTAELWGKGVPIIVLSSAGVMAGRRVWKRVGCKSRDR